VEQDPAEGESTAGRGVDEGRSDEVPEEALLPHLLTTHVESPHSAYGVAVAAAEDDEFAMTDKERKGGTGGVEGRELVDLSGVGVEVKGVVLVALVDSGEIAGDCDGNSASASGVGDSSEVGFDWSAGFVRHMEPIKVDLDVGRFRSWLDGGGPEERSLRFCLGWSTFYRLDGEEVGVGGEDDGGYAAIVREEKRILRKGLTGGKVSKRGEGGEGVADAQEEVPVAQVPEVLAVVVSAPGGASQDVAGGKLEQDCVDGAIHVVLGLVGQSFEQVAAAEGEQKMLIVDVVEREHGAARQKELLGEGLEAELFQRQALRGFGAASCEERRYKGKKKNTHEREAVAERRNEITGNRHGIGRVSLLTGSDRGNAFTDARPTPTYAGD
jgi:hypothetical protein